MLYMPDAVGNRNPDLNAVGFRSPEDRGLNFSNESIFAKDGTELHAWFIHPKMGFEQRDTILFLQGNAGNMGDRMDNL